MLLPLALGAAITLTGCLATAPVLPQMTPDDITAGKTLVLLRVSAKGLKYLQGFSVLARPLWGGEPVQISGWGASSEGYWSSYYDDIEKGSLVAISLPPGDYEFFTFAASAGGWGGGRMVSPVKAFGLPFRVEKGESVYLGQLMLDFKGDTGVTFGSVGMITVDGISFRLVLQDTRARDFKEIAARLPNLELNRLKVRLLK
jgi:hypothetical protein